MRTLLLTASAAFVFAAGDRVLSHTIRSERGRYPVRVADGTDLGSFPFFEGQEASRTIY